MSPFDSNEFMKNLTGRSDEGIVEMARLGREAYVEGYYDCIIGEFNRRRLEPDFLKEIEDDEKETVEGILNTEDFKTIDLFNMPVVVNIYQDALEREGIRAFVPNDYAPYNGQFFTNPNPVDRGVKLQGQAKDIRKAIKILPCLPKIHYVSK